MNEIFLDDLRDKVHRGLSGQAQKGYWCGGKPYGFKLKPILDSAERDAYGQPARVGTVLEVDVDQAAIVREIYLQAPRSGWLSEMRMLRLRVECHIRRRVLVAES